MATAFALPMLAIAMASLDADTLRNEGLQHLEAQELPTAIAKFKQATKLEPQSLASVVEKTPMPIFKSTKHTSEVPHIIAENNRMFVALA